MATTAEPRRKRRSPEELRDLILAAAAHEFEASGYAGATTAAIARRAETTEAQIFRFFASKAELFREAVFEPLNHHFADFQSRAVGLAGEGLGQRALAERYIGELQDFMGEHSRMLMSLIVARAYMPDTTDGLDGIEGLQAYFERGRAMMTARTHGRETVPAELMVRVSFAAVLGCVVFRDWMFPPGLASEEAIRKAIAYFTIDGINANDGARDAD